MNRRFQASGNGEPGVETGSAEPLIRRERDARGAVTLTLNRPQVFNALSEGRADRTRAALRKLCRGSAASGHSQ